MPGLGVMNAVQFCDMRGWIIRFFNRYHEYKVKMEVETEEMEEHLYLLLILPFLLLIYQILIILPKIETIDYIKVLIILFILCKQFLVVE
jgi:hypothetical protein